MRQIWTSTFWMLLAIALGFHFSLCGSYEDKKKGEMIKDLEVIKHHIEVGYAPAEWKKEYAGWDLNEAFENAKNRVLAIPEITTKQFQGIVRDFIASPKDYHLDVIFYSTEAASLPFGIKGAEGRYFIDWIDSSRLSRSYYGIQKGDELLEFDERPIGDVIEELMKKCGKSFNEKTDRALSEINLTERDGRTGDDVPHGPILITIRTKKTHCIKTFQLHWDYSSEKVNNPLDFQSCMEVIFNIFPKREKMEVPSEFFNLMMANPLHLAYAEKYADRRGGIGSRKSYLPYFGEVVWENDEDESNEGEIPLWNAYIYQNELGQRIGYIRIPHYLFSKEEVAEFGKIIDSMEKITEALVIDQLHNIGGNLYNQYLLASMLTNIPLSTPYHRIKITQKDVSKAFRFINFFNYIGSFHTKLSCDGLSSSAVEENHHELDQEVGGRKINFQELLFYKAYCEHVIEDWNRGNTLTRPTPLMGVDKINPHPNHCYTKPILVLINELDFSGGDFFPAILQDNQRGVLFGTRTAGAGGYVFSFNFPNSHGIERCSYTASIAERVDAKKIENLGVSPDIEYSLTADDVQHGYKGYIKSVNEALETMLVRP